eukprot:g11367.t1
MSTRRSPRLSSCGKKHGKEKEVATTTGPAATNRGTHEPKNKRVKRETSPPPAPATAAAAAAAKPMAVEEADAENMEGDDGPSAYELQRLAKIKENARMMASLGLSGAKGEMRTAVSNDAAQRAKARGLAPRQPKSYPARSRESARVRGKTPEGLPMEDPEEAFNRRKNGALEGWANATTAVPNRSPRISGDVSMAASNASEDGTIRLREMMGGLMGRYSTAGDGEDYELAEPDEALKRFRDLKVEETGVCKVARERAYSSAWHPNEEKLLLAVGDKVGNVGLWTVDESNDDDAADGVFQFKPHTGAVPRLKFDPMDSNKLISTSYDGTVRRMDVEKGAFEQVFANKAGEDAFFSDGHLVPEDRLLLLSDGVGDVTAVDLRTNTQVWKREAHEKKANTVHTHPTNSYLFVTASLDRSVRLWDARNLGAGTGPSGVGGMKHLAELPHFRSVNSAHFNPTGEWMATVCQDDKIRLYQDLAEAKGPQVSATHALPHNNQTGRWLTKFQVSWDPKSKGLFAIGSMQKYPHGLHLYSVNGGTKKPAAVEVTGGDIMTSIQSVVAFHPSRDVLSGANASGRAHVFM